MPRQTSNSAGAASTAARILWQRGDVAPRVVQGAGHAGQIAVVAVRLDVRRAARQEQAVKPRDQVVEVDVSGHIGEVADRRTAVGSTIGSAPEAWATALTVFLADGD